MKNLQDSEEKIFHLKGHFPLRVIQRRPDRPQSVILLLHGLDERGLRIYRKLINYLPENALILSPNAPFPLPRVKADRLDFGHAWYFYDRFTKTYYLGQDFALELLLDLLHQANPHHLPLSVIGFSQGGYLAPQLGFLTPQCQKVIGIGCEFKSQYFPSRPHFKISAIHGDSDPIISWEMAKREIEKLKLKDIDVTWHLLEKTKHEINREVGLEVKKILES